MARQRFKSSRICSSDNYAASKKAHREFLERTHNNNVLEIKRITESIKVSKKCYVTCFGKCIEITRIEASRIQDSISVIRK